MLRNKMMAVLFVLLAAALFGASVSQAATVITNTGTVNYNNEAAVAQTAVNSSTVFTKWDNPVLTAVKTRDVGKGTTGTTVTYQIAVAYPRIGAVCADDSLAQGVVITDVIPAGMTFVAGSIRYSEDNGTGWTPVADGVGYSGGTVTVALPDIPEGSGDVACTGVATTRIVEFKVTVD